jgi:hypothetical protein
MLDYEFLEEKNGLWFLHEFTVSCLTQLLTFPDTFKKSLLVHIAGPEDIQAVFRDAPSTTIHLRRDRQWNNINSSPQKKQMTHVPRADNVSHILPPNNVQQSNICTSSRSYYCFASSTPVTRKSELVWTEQVKWDLTPGWRKKVSNLLVAFNVSDAWERTKFYHLEINTSLNRVSCRKWKFLPQDDRKVHTIRQLWSRDEVHNFACLGTRPLFTRTKQITRPLRTTV